MRVSDEVLLQEIQLAAKLGTIRYTLHAEERERRRNFHEKDVKHAIATATKVIRQSEGRIRLEGGTALDGDGVAIVLVIEPRGLRLITVIFKS